jgi:hypothetical protein
MNTRVKASFPDVSVVLAVGCAEDVVGRDVRGLAARLRSLGVSFEILAVNDGCYDTSFAVLGLLASGVPELRLLPRDVSGRAFVRGAAEANGAQILLLECRKTAPPLAALGWILGRLHAGREAVILRGRCIAARRLPSLAALARARGRGELFERSFERASVGLSVEIAGASRPRSLASGLLGPVLRLLAV